MSSVFEKWIKTARRAQGLTQADLGACAGCSETMLRKIESGARQPSRQLAELLARCLGIPEAERPGFVAAARARVNEAPDVGPGTFSRVIGREAAYAQIERAFGSGARAIVLTGPPGVGKSTVAQQASQRFQPLFPDGMA